MKLRDMAENYGQLAVANEKQPFYPSFSVETSQLPEAKNWKIGKTYKVVMEVKMVSMEEKRNRFEMRKIGCYEK